MDNLSTPNEFEDAGVEKRIKSSKNKDSIEVGQLNQEKVDVKMKLEDLKVMRDQNLIMQEEYEKKKAELLEQM